MEDRIHLFRIRLIRNTKIMRSTSKTEFMKSIKKFGIEMDYQLSDRYVHFRCSTSDDIIEADQEEKRDL